MEGADTIDKMDGESRQNAGSRPAPRRVRGAPGPVPERLAVRGTGPSPLAWLFLALLVVMAAGSVFDLARPDKAALLPLVAAPLVAAVALPVRATVVVAVVALLLAVVLPQALFSSQGLQYVRFSALTGLAVLAVVSSLWRQRLHGARLRLDVERERARVVRQQALELNDGVYQSLFAARMWARLGRDDRAEASLDQALEGTARLVADGLEDVPLVPGALRRAAPETAGGPGGSP